MLVYIQGCVCCTLFPPSFANDFIGSCFLWPCYTFVSAGPSHRPMWRTIVMIHFCDSLICQWSTLTLSSLSSCCFPWNRSAQLVRGLNLIVDLTCSFWIVVSSCDCSLVWTKKKEITPLLIYLLVWGQFLSKGGERETHHVFTEVN